MKDGNLREWHTSYVFIEPDSQCDNLAVAVFLILR